ncbi:hypothetical protein RD110_18810 [Rhodoferax koreense]|uniref:Acyltransferase 3 domain-containing protein n=1 Tax=Rhodoferax koreensis TaxID=1842727 RepID=A0A1P8JZ28_9BURK|nr:acyltransferase [Rhodoferax koreense]APW39006.1 hypothetical protein RD110_18810 [Rhodoferax koreense]
MGLIRLYLALVVLFSHIGSVPWFPIFDSGTAVMIFFIFSGFYITMGLNERYKTPASNRTFYLGRFLRLWPTYAVSLAILVPIGVMAQQLQWIAELPLVMRVLAYVANFSMFGIDLLVHVSARHGQMVFSEFGIDPKHNGANYILNMPAWSLSMEMLFYVAAPFVARDFRRCLAFCAVGAITQALFHFVVSPAFYKTFRYDLLYPYVMAYFGLGMLAYWINAKRAVIHWEYFALGFAVAAFSTGWHYAAIAAFVPYVFALTKNSRVDKLLGDLAFPVYVLQLPVAAAVRASGVEPTLLNYFLAVMGTSLLVLFVLERPIEMFRARLRRAKVRPMPAVASAAPAI